MLREALKDVRQRARGRESQLRVSDEHAASIARLREAARSPRGAAGVAGQRAERPARAVAAQRLLEYGQPGRHERPPAWYIQLWHGFANAFSALLAVLAIVSGHEDVRSRSSSP